MTGATFVSQALWVTCGRPVTRVNKLLFGGIRRKGAPAVCDVQTIGRGEGLNISQEALLALTLCDHSTTSMLRTLNLVR